MKLAVITICLSVLLIGAQAAPQFFDFGGLTGMIDMSSKINGVDKAQADPELSSKAEEIIKAMIHKHLDNKKQTKKAARKEQAKAPEPVVKPVPDVSTMEINWDDHPEQKKLLNERIPGGTEAIDALIKLMKEQKAN